MLNLALTEQQLEMLHEAIDSHIYWQLSDPYRRKDGFVLEPGSDESETAQEIVAFRELDALLESRRSTPES